MMFFELQKVLSSLRLFSFAQFVFMTLSAMVVKCRLILSGEMCLIGHDCLGNDLLVSWLIALQIALLFCFEETSSSKYCFLAVLFIELTLFPCFLYSRCFPAFNNLSRSQTAS